MSLKPSPGVSTVKLAVAIDCIGCDFMGDRRGTARLCKK
jgi:hypothetical protein